MRRASVSSSPMLRRRGGIFILRDLVNYEMKSCCGVACSGLVKGTVRCVPSGAQGSHMGAVEIPLARATLRVVGHCQGLRHGAVVPFITRRACGMCVGGIFLHTNVAQAIAIVGRRAHRRRRQPVCRVTSSRVTHEAFVNGVCGGIGSPGLMKTLDNRGRNDGTFTHCQSVSRSVGGRLMGVLRWGENE